MKKWIGITLIVALLGIVCPLSPVAAQSSCEGVTLSLDAVYAEYLDDYEVYLDFTIENHRDKVILIDYGVFETSIITTEFWIGAYMEPGDTLRLVIPRESYDFLQGEQTVKLTVMGYYSNIECADSITVLFPMDFNPWDYDSNSNGVIDVNEVIHAIQDYFEGIITYEQVMQVITLYYKG